MGCGSRSTRRRGTVPEELKKPENFVGNTVLIQIEDGVYFAYAHMQPGSLTVKVGDTVTRQVLGNLGSSGNSSAPHLHFQLTDGLNLFSVKQPPIRHRQLHRVGTVDPAQVPQAFDDCARAAGRHRTCEEGARSVATDLPCYPLS